MYKLFLKRFIDFSLSLIGIIVISPILLIFIILLSFANNGKVFFTQERPGKNATPFRVIKFKSMNDKKDNNGDLLPDRERLTKTGKFIRATSIDELPQLINVLKGDMSFIGPRPLLFRYIPYYTEKEMKRHLVRPGITGLAQVKGRCTLSWDERLAYDVEYVENLSFLMDMKILFMTIKNVLLRKDVLPDKKEHYLDDERKIKLKNKIS